MKRSAVSYVIFLAVTVLACGAVAQLALGPLFRGAFGPTMRAATDGGGVAPMMAGFAVMSLAGVALLAQARGGNWLGHGLRVGLALGAVVAADYLILVGWSTLPPAATILSGLLSGIGPLLGALAAAYYGAVARPAPAR